MDTGPGYVNKKDTSPYSTAGVLGSTAGESKWKEFTRERYPRHHRYHHVDANHGKKGFMDGITLYNLIWVFFVACFIGVVWEMAIQFAVYRSWGRVSGMLYGPFNQVYGFGGVLIVLLLYKFRNRNLFVIFLVSALIGMLFEYCASWVQQLVFHSSSWNYSSIPGNIAGRTNLLFGVGWGLLGMLFIVHFWPWLSEMVGRIPNKIGKPLTIVIAILLAIDLTLSASAVWRASARHNGNQATNIIEVWLDKAYPDAVIKEKYPGMKLS